MTDWDDADVRDRIWDHISTARWFSGKGRDGTLARLLPLAPVVDEHDLKVVPVIALVCYPQAPEEYYQLLLALRPGSSAGLTQIHVDGDPITVSDATTDQEALTVWARTILEADPQAADDSWQLHRRLEAPEPVRTAERFGGEQSNTSIMVGDAIIVKMFRRLEPGDNLDITIHGALNDAGVSSVAKLYGHISGQIPADEDIQTDLAMIIERLPSPGWLGTHHRQGCRSGGRRRSRRRPGPMPANHPLCVGADPWDGRVGRGPDCRRHGASSRRCSGGSPGAGTTPRPPRRTFREAARSPPGRSKGAR